MRGQCLTWRDVELLAKSNGVWPGRIKLTDEDIQRLAEIEAEADVIRAQMKSRQDELDLSAAAENNRKRDELIASIKNIKLKQTKAHDLLNAGVMAIPEGRELPDPTIYGDRLLILCKTNDKDSAPYLWAECEYSTLFRDWQSLIDGESVVSAKAWMLPLAFPADK